MSLDYISETGYAIIRMDDRKANTMTTRWLNRFNRILDTILEEQHHAVVICGREGIFSAGLDTKWLANLTNSDLDELKSLFAQTMTRIYHFPIPTISVISGHAIGGGCMLALACDKRIGIATSQKGEHRLHMNEIQLGIPVPLWAQTIVASRMQPTLAQDMLLFAEELTLDAAYRQKVIHGLTDNMQSAWEKAIEFAQLCRLINTESFAETKKDLQKI